MVGDVNLFFKNSREDPEFEVECEVMIAGPFSTCPLDFFTLTSRQMYSPPQSPCTGVNGVRTLRLSCFYLTPATSSAYGKSLLWPALARPTREASRCL